MILAMAYHCMQPGSTSKHEGIAGSAQNCIHETLLPGATTMATWQAQAAQHMEASVWQGWVA